MESYIHYYIFNIIYFLISIIRILISVAFFTLIERKLLSIFHDRKGPNKASIYGLTQPFSDAIKLLTKEFIIFPKIKFDIYIISPLIIIRISLLLWRIFPSNLNTFSINFSILFIYCCLRISVYPIILGGWASNSSYALLGAIRGLAQTISYEVRLAIIIISPIILCETINFINLYTFQTKINLGVFLFPLTIILYISSLAEVNRSPFDFIEGESELVSGFNIEFFGCGFAYIFLAEYSIIIWIRGMNSIIFFPSLYFIPLTLLYAFSIVWIRASFPRIRYDELIFLCWKIFLPLRISIMRISISLKFINLYFL